MAAPAFIQEAEASFGTNGTATVATGTFDVLTGDILVAVGANEGNTAVTITNNGAALTWALQQEVAAASFCRLPIWTTLVPADRTGLTVTFGTASGMFGGNVFTIRGSGGVGASSKTNVAGGAPTLNLTTTTTNSLVVVFDADFNAVDGTTRTARTNAGAFTEQSYFRSSVNYTVYGGFHANAGAIGTYAVGWSAPAGQNYSIVALELKALAVPLVMGPPRR